MNETKTKPFGFRDKIGYMLGDFGNDFTFLLSSTFLLKFYTDVIGISAAAVGLIMMFARFADSVTDITMGRICDKSPNTKHGKFKPWIRRMCVPVAASSYLMYQSNLADAATWVKVTYLFITYILWGSVFYTSVNIPYGSMASAVSSDSSDRQSLSTFRTMGGMFAGIIISVGVPLIAYTYDSQNNPLLNGKRFMLVSFVFSVLSVVCCMLCFYLTTERVKINYDKKARKSNSFSVMLKNALKNRALISIIVASFFMLLAQLTMQSMSNYVYPNYYRNPAAQSIGTLLMGVSMLLSAVVAKPLSNRFGKAEISIVANFAAAAVCLTLFIIRPQTVWVYVVLQTVCFFGLGVFAMVNWALITDVIDYAEIKNGIREDGTVYALYSFARKLGQAASAGLSGILLSAINYSQHTAFDSQVQNGIFNISTLVPTVGFVLLALVLMFWYPLHKKQVDKNAEILKIKSQNSKE